MLAFLLDTDHMTLYEYAHPLVLRRVALHPRPTVGISDVTLKESLRGRFGALAQARTGPTRITHYAQLQGLTSLFNRQGSVLEVGVGAWPKAFSRPPVALWDIARHYPREKP